MSTTPKACRHSCDDGAIPSSADATRRDFLQQAAGCVVAAWLSTAASVAYASGDGAGAERRYPLPPSDGVTIDRAAQVMLVRAQGRVIALALSCPHQSAAVKWLAAENRFQCSKHDSKYQPDGTYTSGRATRNLDRFPIHRDGDAVVVDVSQVYQSSKDAAGWAAACVTL